MSKLRCCLLLFFITFSSCFSFRDDKYRGHRYCAVTQSHEATPGKGDTPGFTCNKYPCVKRDGKGVQRFQLPRNHCRVVQTSLFLCQSWRANVDFQVLLPDGNPSETCFQDISQLVDYVVSYICKGTESQVEEKKQILQLVVNAEVMTSDHYDVKRLARQVLNLASKHRVISKQECLCQLARLSLWKCTEVIDSISLSGQHRLGGSDLSRNTFLEQYKLRKDKTSMSLHEYFHLKKNSEKLEEAKVHVPSYVGGKIEMTYPVTASFARSALLVYEPWIKIFPHAKEDDKQVVSRFLAFLQEKACPLSLQLSYQRQKAKHDNGFTFTEPTSKFDDDNNYSSYADIHDPEQVEFVELVSTLFAKPSDSVPDLYGYTFDLGKEHDWSTPNIPLHHMNYQEISDWLLDQLDEHHKSKGDDTVVIPYRADGKEYSIDMAHEDQREVIMYVFKRLHDLVTQNSFKPLEMTVRGKAGTGKSVVINTLVTYIRRIFRSTSSAVICGPTGSAAFNAGGVTCHRMFHISPNSKEYPTSDKVEKALYSKLEKIVALIVDERSMLDASIIGRMERYCRKYAYNGRNDKKRWGGIPFVILVGDDFQLPPVSFPVGYGAFHSVDQETRYKIQAAKNKAPYQKNLLLEGLEVFKMLGRVNMELTQSKRTHPGQELLQRILKGCRGETPFDSVSDSDAEELMKLHIRNGNYTNEQIEELRRTGLCLFAKKEPRNKYNASMLYRRSKETQSPVALIRAKTVSKRGNIVINIGHYDRDRVPSSTFICKDANVLLTGWNPEPSWGLYHGTMGTVKDIVFASGENPNHGDRPKYVLCDFPQYKGPRFSQDLPPTYVPIPPTTALCNRNCGCRRIYMPLNLAFAKTTHTFQGASVGPVKPGQPPNSVSHIIVDPGEPSFEAQNPGLLYTMLTRVTTLGSAEEGLPSALYLQGEDAVPSRLQYVTYGKNGKEYQKVLLRRRWVKFLDEHKVKSCGMSIQQQKDLTEWLESVELESHEIEDIFSSIILK